jgi:hypothetical protein
VDDHGFIAKGAEPHGSLLAIAIIASQQILSQRESTSMLHSKALCAAYVI